MTLHQKIFTIIATLAAISLVVIVALAPRVAHAQSMYPPGCGKSADVFKILATKLKQSPIGAGISTGGEMVSIFASKDGAFSIVVTSPDKISCVRSDGTDWMSQKMKPEGRSS